jgi:hypothetical protein
MYARVARWEGADAATLERTGAEIRGQSEEGPPPGLPAKQFLLLHDTAAGKAVAVTMFETEDDYRQGDETLNSMDPPGGGMGERVSVEKFELVVDLKS